jgi:hypothetical protein
MKTLNKIRALINSNITNHEVINELLVLQSKILQIKALNPQASITTINAIAENMYTHKVRNLCLKHSKARLIM